MERERELRTILQQFVRAVAHFHFTKFLSRCKDPHDRANNDPLTHRSRSTRLRVRTRREVGRGQGRLGLDFHLRPVSSKQSTTNAEMLCRRSLGEIRYCHISKWSSRKNLACLCRTRGIREDPRTSRLAGGGEIAQRARARR